MITAWTPDSLREFENDIAECFKRGEIKAPVHLAGGNEQVLIDIFKEISQDDWVCGTWRSHYHCLLKGVPAKDVRQAVLEGHSIGLCFPDYRILCSALVGGIAPIALGLAWAAKRRGGERVWCFLGDMAQCSGLVQECQQYAGGHDLPIMFVVENNGLSVATDTEKAWGFGPLGGEPSILGYKYKLTRPHVGVGEWVHMQ